MAEAGVIISPDTQRQNRVPPGDLLVVVRDPGPGFDPARVPDPGEGPNRLRDGGRGIHLINEFMDEVRFALDGREIQMHKRGPAPGSSLEAEAKR